MIFFEEVLTVNHIIESGGSDGRVSSFNNGRTLVVKMVQISNALD